MQIEFLHKSNKPKLILFFNGWGMNSSIVEHLEKSEFDIICLSNYNDKLNFDLNLLDSYKEIYLVAWSMGVWAAAESLKKHHINFKKAIAINGTTLPIDDFSIMGGLL